MFPFQEFRRSYKALSLQGHAGYVEFANGEDPTLCLLQGSLWCVCLWSPLKRNLCHVGGDFHGGNQHLQRKETRQAQDASRTSTLTILNSMSVMFSSWDAKLTPPQPLRARASKSWQMHCGMIGTVRTSPPSPLPSLRQIPHHLTASLKARPSHPNVTWPSWTFSSWAQGLVLP